MATSTPSLQILFDMARLQATVSRKIDSQLGGGLGFTDIMILFYLSQAEGEKMRRIDLAEKIGLTPSGVTRLLAPMEKIGLIRREANEHDARVSLVSLAPGGKTLLGERIESAELLAEELLPSSEAIRLAAALAGLGSAAFTS
jgi:DNA-binding MarR family transcriptional regulator